MIQDQELKNTQSSRLKAKPYHLSTYAGYDAGRNIVSPHHQSTLPKLTSGYPPPRSSAPSSHHHASSDTSAASPYPPSSPPPFHPQRLQSKQSAYLSFPHLPPPLPISQCRTTTKKFTPLLTMHPPLHPTPKIIHLPPRLLRPPLLILPLPFLLQPLRAQQPAQRLFP